MTVGDCNIFTYRNTEWVELTTWVRIKNSVCKMHWDDCWDGPAWPGVILVGRAGLTAGLFIARWA